MVIVPILGLFIRQRTNAGTWIGAILASVGLFYLSVTDQFTIQFGDLLVLIGAFMWAMHVLIIGWLSPKLDSLRLELIAQGGLYARLAALQFAVCSAFSLMTAAIFETVTLDGLQQAFIPILYGGAMSVGIAYTLQVVAQKHAHPAHAAILLSLEAVFAAIGGWLMLNEIMTGRGMFGCGLMLVGMLLSQLWEFLGKPKLAVVPTTR